MCHRLDNWDACHGNLTLQSREARRLLRERLSDHGTPSATCQQHAWHARHPNQTSPCCVVWSSEASSDLPLRGFYGIIKLAKQPTRHPRLRQSIQVWDLSVSANRYSDLFCQPPAAFVFVSPSLMWVVPPLNHLHTQSSTIDDPKFLVFTRKLPQFVLMLMSCSRVYHCSPWWLIRKRNSRPA